MKRFHIDRVDKVYRFVFKIVFGLGKMKENA